MKTLNIDYPLSDDWIKEVTAFRESLHEPAKGSKANDNHDPKDGRFTAGSGSSKDTVSRLLSEGHRMTKETFNSIVSTIKPLPREVFYLGDVEVVRNPSDSDRRRMTKEVREEFGRDISGDPATRFTNDQGGNTWLWKAHLAIHSQIEPKIASKEGVSVNQNNHIPAHADVVRQAIKDKKPLPDEVKAQYPNYKEYMVDESAKLLKKRAGLQPAGSQPGDEQTILSLVKMGLTRAEARQYISRSRGYGV